MKNRTVKICSVLIVSLVIAFAPIYFFCTEYQQSSIYKDLYEDVTYIDGVDIAIYKFPNRETAQKASKAVSEVKGFTEISLVTAESPLVDVQSCDSEPVLKYFATGLMNGKTKYRATVENGYENELTPSFFAYQLSPILADWNLLKLTEGKMIDFNNKNEDYIEILVTDGLGIKVNDEMYFNVNGLDENLKQVVVKAKVVGIVEKGAFLYGYCDYCGAVRTAEGLHTAIFEWPTVFTGDISYLYEYEREPNSLLDEEMPMFLIGAIDGIDGAEVDALMSENNGNKVLLNANCLSIDNLEEKSAFPYGALIGGIATIILIIFIDVFLIKKISKRDEFFVIGKH